MPQKYYKWIAVGCCFLILSVFLIARKNKREPDKVQGISKAQLQEIIKPLHENIYRAFEQQNPSKAYDMLALSLDGPMLEHVFQEVYSYYLDKDKGGPSVEIAGVKIKNLQLLPSSSYGLSKSATIDFICSWDVLSIVTHYQHWHPRSNNFKGRFQLKNVDGAWKLVQDEILWQQRIKVDLQSYKESS